jgi:hypothetical protein
VNILLVQILFGWLAHKGGKYIYLGKMRKRFLVKLSTELEMSGGLVR